MLVNLNAKKLLDAPFHLRHPHLWQHKVVGNFLTLFLDVEDWALIIFFEQLPDNGQLTPVTPASANSGLKDDDNYMTDYLNKNDFPTHSIMSYTNGNHIPCLCTEFRDKDGHFWFVHSQKKGEKILFATFNAESTPNGVRAKELGQVIQSLCFLDVPLPSKKNSQRRGSG